MRDGSLRVTVAVRGPPSRSAISPSTSPTPHSVSDSPSRSMRADPGTMTNISAPRSPCFTICRSAGRSTMSASAATRSRSRSRMLLKSETVLSRSIFSSRAMRAPPYALPEAWLEQQHSAAEGAGGRGTAARYHGSMPQRDASEDYPLTLGQEPLFCPACGRPLDPRVLETDHRPRLVCAEGHVTWRNPRVVVGALPVREGRVYLARRAIEPAIGRWTYPGGFLEVGESA